MWDEGGGSGDGGSIYMVRLKMASWKIVKEERIVRSTSDKIVLTPCLALCVVEVRKTERRD